MSTDIPASNGRAKWYNDLALVRERLDMRVAALNGLIEPLKKVGLLGPVVAELELTAQVLGQCANTVNNVIQTVTIKMGELALEAQDAKKAKK